ncbi:hypothetical protein E1A91_D12G072500v1 [Gossypium mustelinum]|uniref:Uncharacterized protein n=1 Tax=Gossypium mustelinum TaxID=34275 RepID=A0A5D2SBR5_GOSMU|nr:hypothetical protein E1A91_D12G072500v1 [Gossypium mustelinum]
MQTNLLVVYLFNSFPTIAFITIASNLFFPQTFPVSRFILFVVALDWVAERLRETLYPASQIGGLENCQCGCHCFGYWFGIACLFFFPVLSRIIY